MSEFEEEPEEPKYECPMCKLAFKNRFSLNAHLKVHKRGKPVQGGPPIEPFMPIDAEEIANRTIEQVRGIINKRLKLEVEALAGAALKSILAKMGGIELQPQMGIPSQLPPQIPSQSQQQPSQSQSLSSQMVELEFADYLKAKREALEREKESRSMPQYPQYQPPTQSQDTHLMSELQRMKEKFESALKESQAEIRALKEELSKKERETERKALEDKISKLEESNQALLTRFDEMRHEVERGRGYQSDEVRFLAETLHEGIGILKERKPMADITRVLEKMSEQPPQKQVPVGAGKGLAESLPSEYIEVYETPPSKSPSPSQR